MNDKQRKECVGEIDNLFCDWSFNETQGKKTPRGNARYEAIEAIIAAHDKQPSGEPEYIEINPRLPGKKTAWNKQLLDGINSGKSVAVMLPKEKLEKMLDVKLPKTGVLIFNNATRDPGKVEALIEAAKFVNDYRLDYLYESLEALDADTSPTPLFVILRTFLRFAKELKAALKGVSDGTV